MGCRRSIRRIDFNEDNAKLDAAIKTAEQTAAQNTAAVRQEAAEALNAYMVSNNAAVAALQSAVSTERMVMGSYTGNGTTYRFIELGFTPSLVLQMGYVNTSTGAVTITSKNTCWFIASGCGDTTNTVIVENGFQTACFNATWHNASGKVEHYIAFR